MKTDLQIEVGVLVALSDFTPRNQNQITDIIGNRENSTDRVRVSRALKNLEPLLKRSPNELDEQGKKWTIKQDVETTRQISKKYPPFLLNLQNNEKILSMLADLHNFVYADFMLEEDKEDFKHKLRLSLTLFKTCLMNEPDKLREMFIKLGTLTDRGIMNEIRKEKLERIDGVREPDNFITLTLNDIFVSCVHNDVLNGDENTEAFNHVAEIMFREGSYTIETIEEIKKAEKEIGLLKPKNQN